MLTEALLCDKFLVPDVHTALFSLVNHLRKNFRNVTAHSFGNQAMLFASYVAAKKVVEDELDNLFSHLYPTVRKQLDTITEITSLDAAQFRASGQQQSPVVQTNEVDSLLERLSIAGSDAQVISPAILAKRKRSFTGLLMLKPAKKNNGAGTL